MLMDNTATLKLTGQSDDSGVRSTQGKLIKYEPPKRRTGLVPGESATNEDRHGGN